MTVRPSAESGFALIEALVALAILAVSLGALLSVAADAANRTRLSESRRAAELVAESQLAAAGIVYSLGGAPAEGIAGPFAWRVTMRAAGAGSAVGSLWAVTVTVRMRSGGPALAVLRSMRLAPAV